MDLLTTLEWTGTLTGIVCVALAAHGRILTWPIGLVSVSVYAVFFFQIRLYADSALQIFYIGTGLYGWWHWAHGGPHSGSAPIITLDWKHRSAIVFFGALATVVTGYLLANRTDASLPYWDAFTTCFAIAAQLLLMRKVIENWWLWLVVDVVAVGVYYVKEAFVTCGLYAVFLGIATWGLLSWRRQLRAQQLGARDADLVGAAT